MAPAAAAAPGYARGMNWHTLDPSARWLFYVQAVLSVLLFWAPVTVVGTVVALTQLPWLTVGGLVVGWGVLLLLHTVWWPSLSFARWAWSLREADLVVSSGVVFREVTSVPRARVQHVDVRQGPVERAFGLARVTVYTASGGGADATVPGLRLADAEALRDLLVQTVGDDGV